MQSNMNMKKFDRKKVDEELRGYPINDILEGWFFRVKEISQGYYRVEGKDRLGHSVARDGIDPIQLLSELQNDIHEMFLGTRSDDVSLNEQS
jgi:hypothetical protein